MKPVIPRWVIKGVVVVGDHKLRLMFADGTVGDVSFGQDSWSGDFQPLRDPAEFAKVTIQDVTLYWPEHDLDWAPEPLYEAAQANALTPSAAAA